MKLKHFLFALWFMFVFVASADRRRALLFTHPSPGGNTLVKSEDFSTAAAGNAALSDITGWTDNGGNVGTTDANGGKTAYAGSAGRAATYWSTGGASLNQRVECTIIALGTGVYIGPAARVQTVGTESYYVIYCDSADTILQKIIGGSFTTLQTFSALSAGNKIALEVSGSGASTRISVQSDTGSGWTTLASNIDPGDYLGAGRGGISSINSNTGSAIDDWKWYDLP